MIQTNLKSAAFKVWDSFVLCEPYSVLTPLSNCWGKDEEMRNLVTFLIVDQQQCTKGTASAILMKHYGNVFFLTEPQQTCMSTLSSLPAECAAWHHMPGTHCLTLQYIFHVLFFCKVPIFSRQLLCCSFLVSCLPSSSFSSCWHLLWYLLRDLACFPTPNLTMEVTGSSSENICQLEHVLRKRLSLTLLAASCPVVE